MSPPRFLRYRGLTYEITAHSQYQNLILKMRETPKGDPYDSFYPPPTRVGDPPSIAQRTMLHRLAGCPLPIVWLGCGAQCNVGLPYAPFLNAATLRALWDRGLTMCVAPDRVLVVHARGRHLLASSRVAYEALRWQAILELHAEHEALFAAWRAAGCDLWARPVPKVPQRLIQPRMREIRARALASS